MEGFNEQVVRRVNKPKQLLIKIFSIFLLILIPFLFVVIAAVTGINYFKVIGFFVFLCGIYGVVYTFKSQKVDFEYSVAGNDLEISKVIALRRRKKVCRISINEIEELTKDEKAIDKVRVTKTFAVPRDTDSKDENYYALFNSPAYGKCLLIFSPNEQILQGMKPHLNKTLVIKLFYSKQKV